MMSHWSTLNFDVTADRERRKAFRNLVSRDPETATQEDAHEREDLTEKITQSARYNGIVAIQISGERTWDEDLRIAQSLHPDIWDRCVIVQTKDSIDFGTARLYEGYSTLELVDEYSEELSTDGYMEGEKAAAVMYAEHNIPCLSTFSNPFGHKK